MDEPWQSPDSDGVVFRVIWKSLAKNFRLSESEKIQSISKSVSNKLLSVMIEDVSNNL